MNINLTLIGQTLTFIVFVWFCMKFVWPPIMNALNERKKKIADGLAAAERGAHEKELAEKKAAEVLHEAKQQAQDIINQAQKRASEIVEESKETARSEGERIIATANAEIEQEVNRAREELRGQVASLAVAGAGKILKREIDAKANEDLLKDLVAQI
ncbi:F0F1 ATP synthase subunit B [Thiohalophilus thiocyanatoxydans]|uniref:ATP synthase subunit b n=1 Tax=Thiohalophilus thiocyanatoxydans TaxID=381308 RepID=A0A4R8J0A6_9GAMM|nr:F0F1 ATP synthase subunit B [Thiohalophilus thiocyanatoxydans]TDY03717.1 F-type H+-transporting ATPase subunit b [Thiohalophilus thiocyanatoxydans]